MNKPSESANQRSLSVNHRSFFPPAVARGLQNPAPGSWMPELPESCIRLSAGYPAPNLIPTMDLQVAVQRLVAAENDAPFQYLGSQYATRLREQVRSRLGQRGIAVAASELLITAGGCQGIDLVARAFLDENSVVAVESPTYMEALEIFRNYTEHIVEFPMDAFGLQTETLKQWFEERTRLGLPLPKILYTIPSFHNPTGTTLPFSRRQELIRLAEKYNFLILEDDAYGELSFEKPSVPLKALDDAGRVIYIGSLSKVVAPGMRVGWIAGSPTVIEACAWFKKDLDHPFAEAVMACYLDEVNLAERVNGLRDEYRRRRDIMMQALGVYLPANVTVHKPGGGYFVWLHIPGADTSQLLAQALKAGVAYVPGKYFFATEQAGLEYLRLSYSYLDPDLMVQGVQKLGTVLG